MSYSIVSRVYFFSPGFIVGGGEPFFAYLAKVLYEKNVKIGIIDMIDGVLTYRIKSLLPFTDIKHVNYQDSIWELDDNSVIISPAELFCCLKKCRGNNIRILNIFWNIDTGWRILFQKSEIKKWSRLFDKMDSCVFLDYGICYQNSISLGHSFKKNIVPLYYHGTYEENAHGIINKDEINLVWVGRLSGSKSWALINIIKNYSIYKTNKRKVLHIIGDGEYEVYVKELCRPYENEIKFIFLGSLFGEDLKKYLLTKTDVGIGMGTSILLMSSLAIPTIACSETSNGEYFDPNFIFVCDEIGYCTGILQGKTFMSQHAHSLNELLDEITLQKKSIEIGQKCQKYVQNIHGDLDSIGNLFYSYIKKTKLTYEKFKKVIKFLPHKSLISHDLKLFGVTIFSIKTLYNKTYYYFLNVKIMKIIKNINYDKIYILGFIHLKMHHALPYKYDNRFGKDAYERWVKLLATTTLKEKKNDE